MTLSASELNERTSRFIEGRRRECRTIVACEPVPERPANGVARYLRSRYDLSRATNLAFLEVARDEIRSELLHMQDVVRGTVAADADPTMDFAAIVEEGTRLRRILDRYSAEADEAWEMATDEDLDAAFAEDAWDGAAARQFVRMFEHSRRIEELRAMYKDAKLAKSAFYRADERFEADVEPSWSEVDRYFGGDVIEWRKDQPEAALTVEEFGASYVAPIWAENVPVEDAEAVPYLADLAELADRLTVRIGELRAIEAAGGRLTIEQLERPHARYHAGGVVFAESMLAAEGAIDSRAQTALHGPTAPLPTVERPRYRSADEVRLAVQRWRDAFEAAFPVRV